ncbi:MAG: hypothetical protein V5A57_00530 [Candidatus Paceibacterota bacterium]
MAIEIESESQQSKSNLVNYSLYVGLVLLLIAGLLYGYLFFAVNKSEQKLADLKKQLNQQITGEDEALEDKISNAQRKIDRSGRIIENHKAPSNFFELLEDNTHPQVRFDQMDLSVATGRIKLSGTTEDFSALGQQVNLLQNKDLIKNVDVSGAQLISGGKVGFDILVIVNSDVFNFPQ